MTTRTARLVLSLRNVSEWVPAIIGLVIVALIGSIFFRKPIAYLTEHPWSLVMCVVIVISCAFIYVGAEKWFFRILEKAEKLFPEKESPTNQT